MPDPLKKIFETNEERTTISTSYLLKTDFPVMISTIIGDIGQSAVSEIWIANKKIEKDVEGSFKRAYNNDGVNGKALTIYTIITDTSKTSNYTEVGISINGGVSDFHYRLHKEVAKEGESAFYQIEIFFFQ